MVLTIVQREEEDSVGPIFASRYVQDPVPRSSSISQTILYPRLNLASFVTTWMEPECDKLINRCVNIIARLFNSPVNEKESAVGVGTVGSSEAIMLAGLAFKRRWQNRRRAEGKACDKPNIVTGANVQVCWEKFATYFEVEIKEVKLRNGFYVMDPVKAVEMVDECTICVAAILGSTLTGEFEDIKRLDDLLSQKNMRTGWDTPIHVDAASGGFIAPFLYPELQWDFRLPLVKSINVSGHKYGLVYAGVGWINPGEVNALDFVLQGYKNVMKNCMESAKILRQGLVQIGCFDIISKEKGVPLVAFSFKDGKKSSAFKLSKILRRFGWIVPAYTLPPDVEHMTVLRVVVREDLGRTMVEKFLSHMKIALKELQSAMEAPIPTIRYTIELRPSEAAEEDALLPLPKVVVVLNQEVDRSIHLSGGKTKGVC
ncbi:hypothetical protein BHM03_00052210 [Ensete ventricosum]|nr:hypothetical protein BHM03_00052210 [Ensete ventricosum]